MAPLSHVSLSLALSQGFRATSPTSTSPFKATRVKATAFDKTIYTDGRGIPATDPNPKPSPNARGRMMPSSPNKKGQAPHGTFDEYPRYQESMYQHSGKVEGILRHPRVKKSLHQKAFCGSSPAARSTLPTRTIIFAPKTF